MSIEVPHERRLVVDRRDIERQVIATAGGTAADCVQAVGPGRPGNGAKPAIADRELAREVIVDRDVSVVVVTHHTTWVRVVLALARKRGGVARERSRSSRRHRSAGRLHSRSGRDHPLSRWCRDDGPGFLSPVVFVGELRSRSAIHVPAAMLEREGIQACDQTTGSRASTRLCDRPSQGWRYCPPQ